MTRDSKAAKEAFVSNLAGGQIGEINTVALVAAVRCAFSCSVFEHAILSFTIS